MRQRQPMDDLQQLDARNAELAAEKKVWTSLLADGLGRDPAVDLNNLKRQLPDAVAFDYPKPQRDAYLPEAPEGLARLRLGKRVQWQAKKDRALKEYNEDLARWQEAKHQHDAIERRKQDEVHGWNADIDRFQADYANGEAEAVARYFRHVLLASDYPSAFPSRVELEYQPGGKNLLVNFELPPLELIPAIKTYRYKASRDGIAAVKMKRKRRRRLYAEALAQICLRTLHEIFQADSLRHIKRIAFNGFVTAIDRSTGLRIRPCVLAVEAERELFLSLNLAQVDARLCLRKTLKARLSPKLHKLRPVEILTLPALDAPEPVARPPQPEIQSERETPPLSAEAVEEAIEDTVAEAVEDPVTEAVEDPVTEAVEDPVTEAVEDPVTEVVEDTIDEVVEDPVIEFGDNYSEFFAPVDMPLADDPPTDFPIPPPPTQIRVDTPSSRFSDAARRYADRAETEAEFVSFSQYYPRYAYMTEAQQRWYFYWRAAYRRGETLTTDLSYLFLHAYEIINLVGVDTPRDAVDYLAAFWLHYRAAQPSLDRYLPDWIADLIALHDLAPGALRWYGEAAGQTAAGDLDCLVQGWVDAGEDLERISDDLLFKLAQYNPRRSKFFRQHADQEALCQALKRGVIAFDAALRGENRESLFQSYSPAGARLIKRKPFVNALHDYPDSEIAIGRVRSWSQRDGPGDILRDLLRHSENVMRERDGYSYRLRGISLSEERKSLIAAALMPPKPRPEIVIDHARVDAMKRESEAFRDRMIADAEDDGLPEISIPEPSIDETEAEAESVSLRSLLVDDASGVEAVEAGADDTEPIAAFDGSAPGYLRRPANTRADLLTDLEDVAPIIGDSEGDSAKLLRLMMLLDWQCRESDLESAFEGQFVNTVFDELNERAHNQIDENLICEEGSIWVVEEDYRDEIEYILQHPDFLAHAASERAARL